MLESSSAPQQKRRSLGSHRTLPPPRFGLRIRNLIACTLGPVLFGPAAWAQCPNGTPPPCSRPGPALDGRATLRIITTSPVAGTTLDSAELAKGIPLHIVVEHAIQYLPSGQTAWLFSFADLQPTAKHPQPEVLL